MVLGGTEREPRRAVGRDMRVVMARVLAVRVVVPRRLAGRSRWAVATGWLRTVVC